MIAKDWRMIEPVDAEDAVLRVAPLIMTLATEENGSHISDLIRKTHL